MHGGKAGIIHVCMHACHSIKTMDYNRTLWTPHHDETGTYHSGQYHLCFRTIFTVPACFYMLSYTLGILWVFIMILPCNKLWQLLLCPATKLIIFISYSLHNNVRSVVHKQSRNVTWVYHKQCVVLIWKFRSLICGRPIIHGLTGLATFPLNLVFLCSGSVHNLSRGRGEGEGGVVGILRWAIHFVPVDSMGTHHPHHHPNMWTRTI